MRFVATTIRQLLTRLSGLGLLFKNRSKENDLVAVYIPLIFYDSSRKEFVTVLNFWLIYTMF